MSWLPPMDPAPAWRVERAVEEAVVALLDGAPGLREAPPHLRVDLERGLLTFGNQLAALLDEDVRLSRALEPEVELQSQPGFGTATKDAGEAMRRGIEAINFPKFVQGLITGVFSAIWSSNIEQLEAMAKLLESVGKSAISFANSAISEAEVEEWVTSALPGARVVKGSAGLDVQLPKGFTAAQVKAAVRQDLGLSAAKVAGLGTAGLGKTLIPLVKRELGRKKQQNLATLVMMGLNRIVVDRGELSASMDMRVDARSSAESTSRTGMNAGVNAGASGSVPVQGANVGFSVGANVGVVRDNQNASNEELTSSSNLRSNVHLVFHSEPVQMDQMASMELRKQIISNARVPDAQYTPGSLLRTGGARAGFSNTAPPTVERPPIPTGGGEEPQPQGLSLEEPVWLKGHHRTGPWLPPLEDVVVDRAMARVRAVVSHELGRLALPVDRRGRLARALEGFAEVLALSLAEDHRLTQRLTPPQVEPLDAGGDFSGVAAEKAGGALVALRKAIDFPTFVSGLISGVFSAIWKSNIEQMDAVAELLESVASSATTFGQANIGTGEAMAWLTKTLPFVEMKEDAKGRPSLVMRPGFELDGPKGVRGQIRQATSATEQELKSLSPATVGAVLVPLAQRELGRKKQQNLATLVMMGLNRIVVDKGQLHASMDMRVDTRSAADATKHTRVDASASMGIAAQPWGAAVKSSSTVGVVHDNQAATSEEMATRAAMRSSVDLVFHSEPIGLDQVASLQLRQSILANTRVPDAQYSQGSILADKARTAVGDFGAVARAPMTIAPEIPPKPEPSEGGGEGGEGGGEGGGEAGGGEGGGGEGGGEAGGGEAGGGEGGGGEAGGGEAGGGEGGGAPEATPEWLNGGYGWRASPRPGGLW